MAAIAWDVIKAHPVILNGSTNSSSFAVPRAATSMAVQLPTLTGTTIKLQSLDPQDGTTWHDIYLIDLATAAPKQLLITFTAGACLVFPVDVYGGGNLRIVSGSAEGADRTFSVLFTKSD